MTSLIENHNYCLKSIGVSNERFKEFLLAIIIIVILGVSSLSAQVVENYQAPGNPTSQGWDQSPDGGFPTVGDVTNTKDDWSVNDDSNAAGPMYQAVFRAGTPNNHGRPKLSCGWPASVVRQVWVLVSRPSTRTDIFAWILPSMGSTIKATVIGKHNQQDESGRGGNSERPANRRWVAGRSRRNTIRKWDGRGQCPQRRWSHLARQSFVVYHRGTGTLHPLPLGHVSYSVAPCQQITTQRGILTWTATSWSNIDCSTTSMDIFDLTNTVCTDSDHGNIVRSAPPQVELVVT